MLRQVGAYMTNHEIKYDESTRSAAVDIKSSMLLFRRQQVVRCSGYGDEAFEVRQRYAKPNSTTRDRGRLND